MAALDLRAPMKRTDRRQHRSSVTEETGKSDFSVCVSEAPTPDRQQTIRDTVQYLGDGSSPYTALHSSRVTLAFVEGNSPSRKVSPTANNSSSPLSVDLSSRQEVGADSPDISSLKDYQRVCSPSDPVDPLRCSVEKILQKLPASTTSVLQDRDPRVWHQSGLGLHTRTFPETGVKMPRKRTNEEGSDSSLQMEELRASACKPQAMNIPPAQSSQGRRSFIERESISVENQNNEDNREQFINVVLRSHLNEVAQRMQRHIVDIFLQCLKEHEADLKHITQMLETGVCVEQFKKYFSMCIQTVETHSMGGSGSLTSEDKDENAYIEVVDIKPNEIQRTRDNETAHVPHSSQPPAFKISQPEPEQKDLSFPLKIKQVTTTHDSFLHHDAFRQSDSPDVSIIHRKNVVPHISTEYRSADDNGRHAKGDNEETTQKMNTSEMSSPPVELDQKTREKMSLSARKKTIMFANMTSKDENEANRITTFSPEETSVFQKGSNKTKMAEASSGVSVRDADGLWTEDVGTAVGGMGTAVGGMGTAVAGMGTAVGGMGTAVGGMETAVADMGNQSEDRDLDTSLTMDEDNVHISQDGVTIVLLRSNMWRTFADVGTEMIINRSGRRMFPFVTVQLKGLEEREMYTLEMEVIPADTRRYKFINNAWTAVGVADNPAANPPYPHPESPNTGKHWMSRKIHFTRIKLTNNRESSEGNMMLHSMHKYVVQITVRQVQDLYTNKVSRTLHFRLDLTSFIAVTAYQNDLVTKLKIHNNPFAKAFRDSNLPANNKRGTTKKRHYNFGDDLDLMDVNRMAMTTKKREIEAGGLGHHDPFADVRGTGMTRHGGPLFPVTQPGQRGLTLPRPSPMMWVQGMTSWPVGMGQGMIHPCFYNLPRPRGAWDPNTTS